MKSAETTRELLDEVLTCESENNARSVSSASLVRALHAHRRHVRLRRRVCAGAAVFLAAALLLRPAPTPLVAEKIAPPVKAPLPFLTDSEFLACLDPLPVALVKWPDGRQQLLTLQPASARPRSTSPARQPVRAGMRPG